MSVNAGIPVELDVLLDWWDGEGIDVDRQTLAAALKAKPAEPVRSELVAPPPPIKGAQRNLLQPTGYAQEALELARKAQTIEQLEAAVRAFDGCDLKQVCKSTVFHDGNPEADLMVIGEGPGRDEDLKGLPFVGKSGQLLDKMFAAIGYRRTENLYITNVNYWRPPSNRNPSPEELALTMPFCERHIELVQPKLIIATGAVAARALLETTDGIMRLRGRRLTYKRGGFSCPLVPMMHPAYLLRRPQDKIKSWQDLLLIEDIMAEFGLKGINRP